MHTNSNLNSGRVNQKLRTRESLLHAAAQLIGEGRFFSLAEAADRAKVSRTTAYRYFATPEALRAHAALWKGAAREKIELERDFPSDTPPHERVDALVVQSDRATNEHETEFRAMLRHSLESDDRGEGRPRLRAAVLKKALHGLSIGLNPKEIERLVCALTLTMGIEAHVVLRDVCRLDRKKALSVKRWAARTLLESAIGPAGAPGLASADGAVGSAAHHMLSARRTKP